MSEPVSVRSCMHVLVGKITTGCDWCTGGGLSGAGRAASNTIRSTASESQKGEAGQSWTVCHMAARRHIYMHVDTHTHTHTTTWGLLSDRVRY